MFSGRGKYLSHRMYEERFPPVFEMARDNLYFIFAIYIQFLNLSGTGLTEYCVSIFWTEFYKFLHPDLCSFLFSLSAYVEIGAVA